MKLYFTYLALQICIVFSRLFRGHAEPLQKECPPRDLRSDKACNRSCWRAIISSSCTRQRNRETVISMCLTGIGVSLRYAIHWSSVYWGFAFLCTAIFLTGGRMVPRQPLTSSPVIGSSQYWLLDQCRKCATGNGTGINGPISTINLSIKFILAYSIGDITLNIALLMCQRKRPSIRFVVGKKNYMINRGDSVRSWGSWQPWQSQHDSFKRGDGYLGEMALELSNEFVILILWLSHSLPILLTCFIALLSLSVH